MSTTTTPKLIRPQLGFTKLKDDGFMTRLNAIIKGIDGNPKFPTPPVSATELKNAADGLSAAITAALDGSKKAIAEKKQKREELAVTLRSLAHYVEGAANGDLATLLSSGFEAASTTRNPPQPLAQPSIRKIVQGNTGQLLVTIKAVIRARNYDLRFAAIAAGTTSGSFTTITVPSAKQSTPVNGLLVGTLYTFQVRAYGRLGYTDWSDSVTRMVI